jgi:hypothetical protein
MQLRKLASLAVVAVMLSAIDLAPAQTPRPKAATKATTKAAAGPTLAAAHGTVVKAAADSITFRPRGADGRFDKEIELQVTGTSKFSQLTIQNRGGKPVAVQQDSDTKSLQPQQEISVIYATVGDGTVLLSAVVAAGK